MWSLLLKGLRFIVLPLQNVFCLTGKKRRFKIENLVLYSLVFCCFVVVAAAVVVVLYTGSLQVGCLISD